MHFTLYGAAYSEDAMDTKQLITLSFAKLVATVELH